tara:strand:- start:1448 stop:2029 length:582 start_codon:yes stop_codon:yes gene_type:complete
VCAIIQYNQNFKREFVPHFFFCNNNIRKMQTYGDLIGAGLVAFMFFSLTNMGVKNKGKVQVDQKEPKDAIDPNSKIYASADGIQGRSPDDVCQVKPPEMISTSLLPNDKDIMSDDDFTTITPDKLNQINFLNAGWALGRDTTSNTMRNVSYDLRSELPNPKVLNLENNSFSNTTIGTFKRRAFEPDSPTDVAF